ncbi:E3 ubiquitin-protein ligase makorin-1-like [Neopsephotus bourkii]|uniref:E3 ubiquitin-protein ligase makorin-1-like n=1 Tax=Neopsephotus bourkii TaxID=309878 RepID=UPI002AA52E7B|nr:E3 ubiquitin-protein ligase makorin-1-like [Neopsephotus bourkii]
MEPGSLVARGGCLRPLCRNFSRGFCRWGQSCRFAHDRKSAQTCRYFQSGFCGYGERCSYEHIREEPVPVGTRYGPVPPVPRSYWGSEPAPMATARGWGGARRSLAPAAPSVAHVAFKFPSVEAEERKAKEKIPAHGHVPRGAIGGEAAPARARGASASILPLGWRGGGMCFSPLRALLPAGSQARVLHLDPSSSDPGKETGTRTDLAEVPKEPGAAAAPVSSEALRARSEAVVCGICMDRVYEKLLPEERLFGILPNCSHAYCLGCIRKWRRSRDFQSTVIKACPECRITSSYYIPHKYWVSEGAEKEKLIKAFKARTGKIRCKFFAQNRGCCPFKSDCIYLHELPARPPPPHRQQHPRGSRLGFILSPMLQEPSLQSSDEEDEELCVLEWALSLAMLEADFRYSRYSHEMLLVEFSDSD